MVKTPRTRHSKPQRAPVTIDLQASDSMQTNDGATAQAAEFETAALNEPIESEAISVADMPHDRPVEDRMEEEAATTGRPSSYEPPRRADPPPPPPRSNGGGIGSHLAAGLVGGLLAAGAGWLLSPSQSTAIEPIAAQVAAQQGEIASLKAASENAAGLPASVDQIRSDLTALQAAVQAGGGEAVSALNDKIAQLEQSLASLSAAADPTQLEGRVGAVEQSVAGLTSRLDSQASQPKIALSIAAAGLKSALERGAPFTAELETFAAISPNAAQIEPLRAYAGNGVVSRADIAKAFPAAADAMVAAAAPAADETGFFQRLLNSAQSVVHVRPVGEAAGDDPAARVARMEVAVNAGDYAKALSEFDALPDAVKAAGASVVDLIRARADVEQLTDQMIADAMKAA